jgi:inosine-uridine nucleoside N-ribohydrolase
MNTQKLLNWKIKREKIASILCAICAVGFLTTPLISNAAPPSKPTNLILDHDGAFEDYYNILVAALLSEEKNPKIKLIGVTTNAVGESYCAGSNRYPKNYPVDGDVKNVSIDRSIDGLTEKVLSIAKYPIPIYSGCDESTATKTVDNIKFKLQLPLRGIDELGACLQHQELVFAPTELQCYYEFPKRFRDESLLFVDPVANSVITNNKISKLNLINKSINASDYLAKQMCGATPNKPLIVFTGGPMTNLARALEKINKNPSSFGCSKNPLDRKAQLAAAVATYHMAGGLDTNPNDNSDVNGIYKLRGSTLIDANGQVILTDPNDSFSAPLQQDIPIETEGNVYWASGFHVFAGHHDPYGTFATTNQHRAASVPNGDGTFTVDNNLNAFNALNNAEYNMFVDSSAADVSIKSGIPNFLVGINATQYVPLDGFRVKLGNAIEAQTCKTPAAQFVFGVQSINTSDGSFFGYDTLFFWDELALTSISELNNNFVHFESKNIGMTTRTSGENHQALNPANNNAAIWPRDAGKMYEVAGGSAANVGMGVNASPEVFKETFQTYIFNILCSQK